MEIIDNEIKRTGKKSFYAKYHEKCFPFCTRFFNLIIDALL